MDASEINAKKTQCKGSNISQRRRKIHIPCRRWTNKIRWRRCQGDGVSKAGLQQAADSRGSRTCVCANTFVLGVAHAGEEG